MQIARFNQEILIGLSKLAGISAKVSELEIQIVYKRYATEKRRKLSQMKYYETVQSQSEIRTTDGRVSKKIAMIHEV